MAVIKEMLFEEVDVEDFAKWKLVFDKYRAQREAFGFLRERVFRSTGDPNHVAMIFDIESREIAARWMESDALRAIRREAGVVGEATYGYNT